MPRQLLVALVAMLLAAGLAACGGSDDSNATTATDSGSAAQAEGGGGAETGKGEGSSGENGEAASGGPDESSSSEPGTAPFRVKGGDNSIQEFGSEADESDLEAAAAALQGFLNARVAGDWAEACAFMSEGARQGFEQLASESKQLQGKGCGPILGALSKGIPKAALEEAAQVDAGAVRVEGERAFLLYHGADDVDFAIPMAREEDGSWKVAALAGTPLS